MNSASPRTASFKSSSISPPVASLFGFFFVESSKWVVGALQLLSEAAEQQQRQQSSSRAEAAAEQQQLQKQQHSIIILDELSGVGVGGCGVHSLKSGAGWFGRRWGHLELLSPGNIGVQCLV